MALKWRGKTLSTGEVMKGAGGELLKKCPASNRCSIIENKRQSNDLFTG